MLYLLYMLTAQCQSLTPPEWDCNIKNWKWRIYKRYILNSFRHEYNLKAIQTPQNIKHASDQPGRCLIKLPIAPRIKVYYIFYIIILTQPSSWTHNSTFFKALKWIQSPSNIFLKDQDRIVQLWSVYPLVVLKLLRNRKLSTVLTQRDELQTLY